MDAHTKHNNVLNLKHAPIPHIKIGIIGLGNRGVANLKRYMQLDLDGIEIIAFADIDLSNINKGQKILVENNRPRAKAFIGSNAWRELCEHPTINLIIICTDWLTHAAMAKFAMERGKHVAIEVPIATSVADCQMIVDTAEKTQRHCTMLENCCYDPFALTTLNMVRQGVFGDISHVEGAYIHDLRNYYFKSATEGGTYNNWTLDYCTKHTGNPYPTHGLGPISKVLGLNNGDYMTSLTSMSSSQLSLSEFAKSNFGEQSRQAKIPFKMGDMNTTMIRTKKGRTIMLQYSVALPRPYNRLYTICGTKGFAQKYPIETITLEPTPEIPLPPDKMQQILSKYEHPFITNIGRPAQERGVENIMNYMMDYRLIYCLQNGLPLDINIYEAAQWSCIAELSEKSVLNGGMPIQIPNFITQD